MNQYLNEIKSKIYNNQQQASLVCQQWQKDGDKVVFTNGCFDILHQGHIMYLAKAATLGSRLIIGLNTDASIQRIKGEDRPINGEQERALLLAALFFTDIIVFFDEDTPYNLIETTLPDILVKGADYRVEDIVGYDIIMKKGGQVETIVLEEGFSTTSIIDKIQKEK